jgi:hypothetical protein
MRSRAPDIRPAAGLGGPTAGEQFVVPGTAVGMDAPRCYFSRLQKKSLCGAICRALIRHSGLNCRGSGLKQVPASILMFFAVAGQDRGRVGA